MANLEEGKGKKFIEYEIFPGFIVFRFEDDEKGYIDVSLNMDDIIEEMNEVAKEDYKNNPCNWRHP